MTTPFLATSSVYETAETSILAVTRLAHTTLNRFHRDIRWLDRLLHEQGADEDPLWRETASRLRRFRFLTSATPLPFDHGFLWEDKAQAAFRRSVSLGVSAYPALRNVAESLAVSLAALRMDPSNPLWTAIQESGLAGDFTGAPQGSLAILLPDTRSVAPVEALVAPDPRFKVVTAPQLKDDINFSCLFVPGISSWYPDFCFTAPRAREIRFVQYCWLRNSLSFNNAFVASTSTNNPASVLVQEPVGSRHVLEELELIEVSVPEIDWALAFRAARRAAGGGGAGDVSSHLYVLEGNNGVWFEDAPDASVLTISLTSTGDNVVRRRPVQKLLAGEFVLLRTGGGGDLIVSVADRTLGAEGVRLRSLQEEWKQSFRKRVAYASSVEAVQQLLRRYGCRRASAANIRNWMSARNISPEDEEDFRAVLTICGLEERFAEFVEAMDRIDSAHRSAGRRISIMILNAVSSEDTTPLRREGVQIFNLPQGEGGGSFTAYRLVERSRETAPVPAHRLSQVFTLEN